jgi:hypothetical protein
MYKVKTTFFALLLISAALLSAENPQKTSALRKNINKIDAAEIVEHTAALLADDENATLTGQWARGVSYGITADNSGHVFFGDGGEFVCATIDASGEIVNTGSVILPGITKDVELSSDGNYAYVAMGYNGLAVVDISSLSNPQLVNVLTQQESVTEANAVSESGSNLYIAAGYQGLLCAQINSAEDIVISGVYQYENCNINDVAARNDTIFSASGSKALEMLRFSEGQFHLLNQVNYNKYTDDYTNQTPSASAVVWNDNALFVADAWTGVFVFSIDDTVITHRGHALGACSYVAVQGDYLYVTDYNNLSVFYWANGTPVFKTSESALTSKRVAVSEDYVFIARESYGIYSFDISNSPDLIEGDRYANASKTYDVVQQGYYLYRITPRNSVKIISVFDPTEPKTVTNLQLDVLQEGLGIYVYGDTMITYAYNSANGSYSLFLLSLDNFYIPDLLAVWKTNTYINDIMFSDKKIYVAQNNDLVVIDFSDLSNVHEVGRVTTSGWIEDMTVQGNYVFTASEDAGMCVIDVSDPANPQEKTSYKQSDETYYVKIVIQGNYAYIANSGTGLTILDIASPETPVMVSTFTETDGDFNADWLAVSGNYVYIQREWGEVIFLNAADPNQITVKGSYHLSEVDGLTAYSKMLYAANTFTGIYIVSNDNPDALAPCHVAGEVSGEWTCSKIYVEDDITIPAGDTLRISDSVEKVIILGPYQIKVEGVLLAMGPEDGRVGLYGEDMLFQGSNWKGILFNNLNDSQTGTSIISHCRFDYADKMDMTYQGGGAIAIYNSDNVIIKNSTFYRNTAKLGGAIYIENAAPKIENCYFEVNGRGGVGLSEYYSEGGGAMYIKNADPYLHHLRFIKNGAHGGGAIVIDGCSPKLSNILIEHNKAEGIAGGIHCINGASPHIINMTAADNTAGMAGGALYLNANSNPLVINSILYNNTKPEIYLDGGTPIVTYSLVDSAGEETWFGEGCLDTDPLFDESANIDYHLKSEICGNGETSPAIDAGHPDSIDTRLDCDAGLGTARADMGYYGGRFADMVTSIENKTEYFTQTPTKYELEQNYPNPFNPLTTIRFTLPAAGHVTLKIYNVLGEEVAVLIDKNMNAGIQKVVFNAARFSSGVYFYKLDFDKNSIIRKMILMK